MSSFENEFWDLSNGIIISSVGFLSIIIALFRLKSNDYTLLTFGFFSSAYGIRWLDETMTMQTLIGFPFTSSYFNTFLTYILVILIALFFVQIFGRGVFNSMLWVFWSTLLYAIIKIPVDLIYHVNPDKPPIIPAVVIVWCFVWVGNLLLAREQSKIELWILRIVSSFAMLSVVHDQIINMYVLPWNFHMEHAGFITFFVGMAFATALHFFSNEKKLVTIEQEVEIARRIQQSNLPAGLQPPKGIDMAARYVPMSAVAGDFYDVHIESESSMGILIADVSGHGIGASLIGSMLKIAFASQVHNLSDPSEVLNNINQILQGKMEDSYITACYVYIDLENKKMVYANAGHPPPLLYNTSTRSQRDEFSIGGTIIGPFANSTYESGTLPLLEGDRLVLYTDGLTETKNLSDEFYGEDRLKTFISRSDSESANDVVGKLLKNLMGWSGRSRNNSLEDDLTLIIIDLFPGKSGPGNKLMNKN